MTADEWQQWQIDKAAAEPMYHCKVGTDFLSSLAPSHLGLNIGLNLPNVAFTFQPSLSTLLHEAVAQLL